MAEEESSDFKSPERQHRRRSASAATPGSAGSSSNHHIDDLDATSFEKSPARGSATAEQQLQISPPFLNLPVDDERRMVVRNDGDDDKGIGEQNSFSEEKTAEKETTREKADSKISEEASNERAATAGGTVSSRRNSEDAEGKKQSENSNPHHHSSSSRRNSLSSATPPREVPFVGDIEQFYDGGESRRHSSGGGSGAKHQYRRDDMEVEIGDTSVINVEGGAGSATKTSPSATGYQPHRSVASAMNVMMMMMAQAATPPSQRIAGVDGSVDPRDIELEEGRRSNERKAANTSNNDSSSIDNNHRRRSSNGDGAIEMSVLPVADPERRAGGSKTSSPAAVGAGGVGPGTASAMRAISSIPMQTSPHPDPVGAGVLGSNPLLSDFYHVLSPQHHQQQQQQQEQRNGSVVIVSPFKEDESQRLPQLRTNQPQLPAHEIEEIERLRRGVYGAGNNNNNNNSSNAGRTVGFEIDEEFELDREDERRRREQERRRREEEDDDDSPSLCATCYHGLRGATARLDNKLHSILPAAMQKCLPPPLNEHDYSVCDIPYFFCCRGGGLLICLLAILGCAGLAFYMLISCGGGLEADRLSADWTQALCIVRSWRTECCCCGSGRAICDYEHLREQSTWAQSLILRSRQSDQNVGGEDNAHLRCPPGYRALVEVTLSIDNKRFNVEAYRFASGSWDTRSGVDDYTAGLTVGTGVDCWYDPDNPTRIKLEGGTRKPPVALVWPVAFVSVMVLFPIFIGLCLCGLILFRKCYWRILKKKRDDSNE